MDEAEENNLGLKVQNARLLRWHRCSLCEQKYHGVVACALGWACWKTYVGRPEGNWTHRFALGLLGNGLQSAEHNEEALSVKEAELSTERRLGASASSILAVQTNLATTYAKLGLLGEALRVRQDVYSARVKLSGEEHYDTLIAANNCALSLLDLKRFKETKALLRKMIPVVRRVLGESHEITLQMRWNYGEALRRDSGSTLDDVREAVTSLEDAERTARRVLGGAHPNTCLMAESLENARALLRAYEPSPPPTTSY